MTDPAPAPGAARGQPLGVVVLDLEHIYNAPYATC